MPGIVYYSDNFESDTLGTSPSGYEGLAGSINNAVVVANAPTPTGQACQVTAGYICKGPTEGAPGLSSFTIYSTFLGCIGNSMQFINSGSGVESFMFTLKVEPDFSVSLYGSNNEYITNGGVASSGNWNTLRMDIQLGETPTAIAYLTVSATVYLNYVVVATAEDVPVYDAIVDLPTTSPVCNFIAWGGGGTFTNIALCDIGVASPFLATSPIDCLVEQMIAEVVLLATPNGRLSQYCVELLSNPLPAPNRSSIGVFSGTQTGTNHSFLG